MNNHGYSFSGQYLNSIRCYTKHRIHQQYVDQQYQQYVDQQYQQYVDQQYQQYVDQQYLCIYGFKKIPLGHL